MLYIMILINNTVVDGVDIVVMMTATTKVELMTIVEVVGLEKMVATVQGGNIADDIAEEVPIAMMKMMIMMMVFVHYQ